MRRTTRATTLALVVLTLALTACGTDSDSAEESPSRPSSPSSSLSPSPSATGSTSCAAPAELTDADSGRTVCLAVGGQLRLNLDGTAARPWSTVATKGDGALKAINAGAVVLPGDAVAAYEAVTAGTVRLTASRPLCAQPTAPGQVACKAIQEWNVTVRVTELSR